MAVTLMAACGQPTPTPPPQATAAPSRTPTPSPVPTATPSPTPTAPPLAVTGDLRSAVLNVPVAQRGAPCGIVDVLDFPLGPPDGAGYNARYSFGRYSGRYNGIHAGEDWGLRSGSSLGKPVYSIGHGMVTYAQPLGWGVDKGVVIVRHMFPDGSTFLSFYGHLDPPSVVLRAGDCVRRGDQVGAVGKPRGRPHLHFEIRTHLPGDPGPGYWSVDPRLAGWLSPSDTIWNYRIQISPGVQWTRPFTETGSIGVGALADGTLVALNARALVGVDPASGSLRWSQPLSNAPYQVVADATGAAIYLANHTGSVQAIGAAGETLWQVSFGTQAKAALMPLPGGGVVAHANKQLTGLSAPGETLWQIDLPAQQLLWALAPDRLIFTTNTAQPALYGLDASGQLELLAQINGRPVVAGDQVFIYHPGGIYRLEPDRVAARRVHPLDPGLFAASDIAALADGSVVVSHDGSVDRRLIWLNADGTLRWEQSVAGLSRRPPRLIAAGDRAYAITTDGDVLWLDPLGGEARLVFDAGGGTRLPGDLWALVTADGRMLLDFRSGKIVALDPGPALAAVGGVP